MGAYQQTVRLLSFKKKCQLLSALESPGSKHTETIVAPTDTLLAEPLPYEIRAFLLIVIGCVLSWNTLERHNMALSLKRRSLLAHFDISRDTPPEIE